MKVFITLYVFMWVLCRYSVTDGHRVLAKWKIFRFIESRRRNVPPGMLFDDALDGFSYFNSKFIKLFQFN